MKKIFLGLLTCGCIGIIGYTIYYNQTSCPVGRSEYYVFYESEIQKVIKHFKLNASFYNFKNDKIIEALQQGKIQVAYGEFFSSEGTYQDLIKSDVYHTCSYGVYHKKAAQEIAKIGYYYEAALPTLKAHYPKCAFVKYESVDQLVKDVHSGAVDGACVADWIAGHLEKGFTFKILPGVKKQLVCVFSPKTKLNMKEFNDELKKIHEPQEAK